MCVFCYLWEIFADSRHIISLVVGETDIVTAMNEESLSQLYLKDTAFQALMQRRIINVLLIASPYDAFMMEEDGRVEEQLYLSMYL